MPCAGFSWLFVRFWAHVNTSFRTVSYRIVIGNVAIWKTTHDFLSALQCRTRAGSKTFHETTSWNEGTYISPAPGQASSESLEFRRIRLDLVFDYKVMFNLVDVNRDEFFTVRINHSRRAHRYKLYLPYGKTILLDTIISAIESVVFGILFHLMMLIFSQCIDFIIV